MQREKKGGIPPRFRGVGRYDSFCYPQSGFSLRGQELKLSKIGHVRIKMHRPIGGKIKTCTLKRLATGAWEVSFSCEVEVSILPPNDQALGIDVGIKHFATYSNGTKIPNPRFFEKGERALSKAQRKLSSLEKGTQERRKQGKVVAKIHRRIGNQRKDFCHKLAKEVIENYQYICLEDLNIQQMVEKVPLAKRILDASWSQFRQFLTYKAEEAGRKIGLVNPAYTTQDCSRCGSREPKRLSDREHDCSRCGYKADRDFNAAENILALGLDGLGKIPRSPRL